MAYSSHRGPRRLRYLIELAAVPGYGRCRLWQKVNDNDPEPRVRLTYEVRRRCIKKVSFSAASMGEAID